MKAWCENSESQHEVRSSQYPGEHSMQTESMEAHTLCSRERSVCVGGNGSASEGQDRAGRMMKIHALGRQREKAMQMEGTSFVFQIFTYFTLVHVYPCSLT